MRAEIAQVVSTSIAQHSHIEIRSPGCVDLVIQCGICDFQCKVSDIEVLTVYEMEIFLCGQCRNKALTYLYQERQSKQELSQSRSTSGKEEDQRLATLWQALESSTPSTKTNTPEKKR